MPSTAVANIALAERPLIFSLTRDGLSHRYVRLAYQARHFCFLTGGGVQAPLVTASLGQYART